MPLDGTRPATSQAEATLFAITEFREGAQSAALGAYPEFPSALAGIKRHRLLNHEAGPDPGIPVYFREHGRDSTLIGIVVPVISCITAFNPSFMTVTTAFLR